MGAPRSRASAGTRCHVTCGAAGAPLSPVPLPFGTRGPWVLSWRGGEAWGCGFPRLGFPPGAPLSEAPPFKCGSSAGGKTHPRSVACAPSLGATARRPFSYILPPSFRHREGYGGLGGFGNALLSCSVEDRAVPSLYGIFRRTRGRGLDCLPGPEPA